MMKFFESWFCFACFVFQQNHLITCEFVDVLCTKGCGQTVERRALDNHVKKECPKRMSTCPHCKTDVQHRNYTVRFPFVFSMKYFTSLFTTASFANFFPTNQPTSQPTNQNQPSHPPTNQPNDPKIIIMFSIYTCYQWLKVKRRCSKFECLKDMHLTVPGTSCKTNFKASGEIFRNWFRLSLKMHIFQTSQFNTPYFKLHQSKDTP